MISAAYIATERLKQAGLRPTRQRIALVDLLFADGHRHLTAEQLRQEAVRQNIPVSLATVYNTLHHLTRVGLVRQVIVEPGQSCFDTNIDPHHHFYHEKAGLLEDIEGHDITVTGVPDVPAGSRIARVDVIVRLVDETAL